MDSWKEHFYIQTNKDARDYKILRCKINSINKLEEFIPSKKETVIGELLRKLDLLIRYILSLLLIALGIFCLTTNSIIQSDWLSWKIIIFGLILVNGIWIRAIVGRMRKSIRLAQESDTKIEGEKSIKKDQAVLNKAALLIWVLVILMAFLGELKPL